MICSRPGSCSSCAGFNADLRFIYPANPVGYISASGKSGACLGKKLTIISFLICLAIAMYVFASKESKSLRDNLVVGDARDAQIILEDFVAYKYEGSRLDAKLSGKLANFYEPNLVEIDGDIRGERATSEDKEFFSAETASAFFKAESLTGLMEKNVELDRAEVSGFVEFGVKGHVLTTDYAELLNDQQQIRSNRPVRVEGIDRMFAGEEGFTYDLKKESLYMPGRVKGVVQIEEKN